MTAAREYILDILAKTDQHMSAEDIFFAMRPARTGIGMTTIYRTLDVLEQAGIVCKFDFGHGRAKYELDDAYGSKKHHHHLICEKCGKIIDYSDFMAKEREYLKEAEAGLEKAFGFTIRNHVIAFYGLCPACATA